MKHYNFLFCLLASFLLFFAGACNDDDKKAASLVCFGESGRVSAKISYLDETSEFKISILNKGMGALTLPIGVCTQSELDAYNEKYSTDYTLLPEGTYKLSESSVSFTETDKSKELTLTVYPKKLFDAIRNSGDTGKQYALPLKTGAQNICEVVYAIEITYPELRLEGETYFRLLDTEVTQTIEARTYEKVNGKFLPTTNKGEVSMPLVLTENAKEWVKKYNKTYETNYKLLPVGAYELGTVIGKEGEEKCIASVTVKRTLSTGTPLEFGKYILPIQLSSIDERVAASSEIHVITVSNPNNYDDTGINYDDGTNIIYHVKLAIDEEGYKMMDEDMEFFKNQFEIQWEEINKRFNALDKKNILKRNYIFVPDLKDIIIFKYENASSNWNVAYDYRDRIDSEKFQLVVSYDFFKQEDEGGGGYGGKAPEGMGHIKVTCYSNNKDQIRKCAGIDGLIDESIVHELGHYRGLIDTYNCSLNASSNKVNGQGFQPERGNMMGACYEPTEKIEWSEYEMYVINATGAPHCSIWETVADYFPENMEISVTENGQPAESFTLKFYPMKDGKIETASRTHTKEGDKITIDAKKLFWKAEGWWDSYPWEFYYLFLVEAISKDGKKAYRMLPVYEVHKQGLLDKSEYNISGNSTFRMTIDIK